jgi:hypothetical protein
MLAYFILDLALRLIPLGPLTFRAWEAMLRHFPNVTGPFIPNKHYHRDRSYGGVAAIGNLPALREYHTADFTTDDYGFHNPPALARPDPAGIVIGDSFAVGSELPEDETFSAQLTRRCGRYFYNAGAPQPLRLASLEAVAQRLRLQNGVVIFEFLEARALQNPPSLTPEGAHHKAQGLVWRTLGTDWTDRLATPVNELHASPLEAISAKAEKQIQNGWLLPNSFSRFVTRDQLVNGQSILFLPEEFLAPAEPWKAAAAWAAYFSWYAAQLRNRGLKLLVVLVPNRATIYAPLLEHARDVSESAGTLSDFASALQTAGVSAVSLEERYARDAPVLLGQQRYLYFLDDIHWNGTGTGIAADEVLGHHPEELACSKQ